MATLYRTSIESETGRAVWWSPTAESAEEMMVLYMEDARHLTGLGVVKRMTIEQTVWGRPTDSDFCGMLNGLWDRRPRYRVVVERGEVVEFERQTDRDPDVMEPVPLEMEGPTPEYAKWYSWLVNNPAMYGLCRRSGTTAAWAMACEREQVKIPTPIRTWLFRTVRHKGKR